MSWQNHDYTMSSHFLPIHGNPDNQLAVFSDYAEWAHWDSNPEPKDYAYHFGFRRRRSVRGLDHAFTLSRLREI